MRLNGFLQTDDKLALREIWRQLGREMEVDEEVTKKVLHLAVELVAIANPFLIAKDQ